MPPALREPSAIERFGFHHAWLGSAQRAESQARISCDVKVLRWYPVKTKSMPRHTRVAERLRSIGSVVKRSHIIKWLQRPVAPGHRERVIVAVSTPEKTASCVARKNARVWSW